VRGGRGAQFGAAQEGEVAVGVVLADGGAGGLDRGRGRRDVGVEVLQAEDFRVGLGGLRDPVDREADDVAQAGGSGGS